VEGIIKGFAETTGSKNRTINLLPGWVEPSDMREIRRLCKTMGAEVIVCPDTSDVLDAPQTGTHQMYPKGGTTVKEIASSGDSIKTLALGAWASEDAAKVLDSQFKVPYEVLDIPIGLSSMDRFLEALAVASCSEIPESFVDERGRLVDVISDMSQYLYGKKVALFGDPDQLIPLTEFLLDLDMIPTHIVSGTPGKKFTAKIKELQVGQVLEVVADDRGIKMDMPAWCRATGHEYLGVEEKDGEYRVYVKKEHD